MQLTTVEVNQAEEHMNVLIDAVLHGGEVVLTHFGEPVASVQMRYRSPDAPLAELRATVVKALDDTLNHLRVRLDPPAWLLN